MNPRFTHPLYGNFAEILRTEDNAINWCQEVKIMQPNICDICHNPCPLLLKWRIYVSTLYFMQFKFFQFEEDPYFPNQDYQ
ncbi:unnamed protein product [Blepharisma stoltei]|uniref:Uncharacterized protein n=1 Tax=Blepharisma stoltei TaxID=1481888 RepID=A0AAU9KDZ9_9CILI|nr:unnamed protein product [Blepharisma stoltei]